MSHERAAYEIRHRGALQETLLQVVALAGTLALGLVLPNVLGALARMGLVPKSRQSEYIRNAQDALVRGGYVRIVDGTLVLTKRGRSYLHHLKLKSSLAAPKKKWDKRWRVLIFDIDEERKMVRHRVRGYLVAAGFVRLQDSVWVYPYACEEYISLLKSECRINSDLLYMIVEYIEGSETLKKHFKLNT